MPDHDWKWKKHVLKIIKEWIEQSYSVKGILSQTDEKGWSKYQIQGIRLFKSYYKLNSYLENILFCRNQTKQYYSH